MTAKHLSFTRMLKNFRKFIKQNSSWLGPKKYDSLARPNDCWGSAGKLFKISGSWLGLRDLWLSSGRNQKFLARPTPLLRAMS